MYVVYILKCKTLSKHQYYIGVTRDLNRRIAQHNSVFNNGYTRVRKWRLVYIEGYPDMRVAYDREIKLKQFGNVWYGVTKRIKSYA